MSQVLLSQKELRIAFTLGFLVFVAFIRVSISDHLYPPTVWADGEVVQEQVQISAAKLQAGGYAMWMGMRAPVTKRRAAVEVWHGVVVENRALQLEFQLGP